MKINNSNSLFFMKSDILNIHLTYLIYSIDDSINSLNVNVSRVKSGIFGQTAKFGQPSCLFHSSIIGIKN